ncbi:MAG: sigma-70 family RNA polymerase sigma factor [Verrucomicrobiae bacterium]|nr:sigma-70 family RNA polymerase sigma factor [Verrucomicrobiae bacterium]
MSKPSATAPAVSPTPGGNPPPPVDDAMLVQRARAGDLDAFGELVRRHQERVYGTVYHMTANHEDAADITQESFIKAHNALRGFKGDCSFFTWLYRIAVNRTLNFLKQRRQRVVHLSLNDLDFQAEHDPEIVSLISDRTPRRDIDLGELQEKLNAALLKLSEVHRMVVVLHDIQGLPHEEIATIMDCNPGTVRSRLFYARQQLQAYLSDYLQ